jgi:hypothetical protein
MMNDNNVAGLLEDLKLAMLVVLVKSQSRLSGDDHDEHMYDVACLATQTIRSIAGAHALGET